MRTSKLFRQAGGALRRGPRSGRYTMISGLSAILLSACAASAAPPPPLMSHTAQRGISTCIQAPDQSSGIDSFDSPIGLSPGLFYNQSGESLTVESVSLLRPHNLVLHAVVVYEMAHYSNP